MSNIKNIKNIDNKIPEQYVGESALEEAFRCIYDFIRTNSPSISVHENTEDTYILKIQNPDGSSFLTPNLIRSK